MGWAPASLEACLESARSSILAPAAPDEKRRALDLLGWMLQPDPARRPQSLAEVDLLLIREPRVL